MTWQKTSREIPCKDCNGSGEEVIYVKDSTTGKNVPITEDCGTCGGSGAKGAIGHPDDAYAR